MCYTLHSTTGIIHARPWVNWTVCDVWFVDMVDFHLFNGVARLKISSVWITVFITRKRKIYVWKHFFSKTSNYGRSIFFQREMWICIDQQCVKVTNNQHFVKETVNSVGVVFKCCYNCMHVRPVAIDKFAWWNWINILDK